MKLSDFMTDLTILIKDNPEILDYEVITARDDEGNGYNRVYFSPTIGVYSQGYFYTEMEDVSGVKCICLN